MTRLVYVPNRILDLNGVADGASVTVYQSGTTTKISLFADPGCTVPVANPYTVSAGAAFPALYYSYVGNIRVYIVSDTGEIQDEDPYYSIVLTTEIQNYAIAPVGTRAALAALTIPAADTVRELTEANRAGLFKYDTSNLSALVTADPNQGIYVAPASAPTGASGAWVRQYDGRIYAKWFGPVLDGIVIDGPKILSAYTLAFALAGSNLTLYGTAAPSIVLPFTPSGINMGSTTISLTKTIATYGETGGTIGGAATWLKWPSDCNGFEVRADNCYFDGIGLGGSWTAGSPAEGEFHAIKAYRKFGYGRLFIENWRGDGIHINVTAGSGGDTEGNCNGTYGDTLATLGCRRGISLEGNDANACSFNFIDANYAFQAGVYEASGLGNSYNTIQTSGCGVQGYGTPCATFNNGHIFYVISSQETGASTNSPPATATSNTWWAWWKDAGAPTAYAPQWTSGLTWRAGGAVLVPAGQLSNNTSINYLYAESDQPPVQTAQEVLTKGGLNAAGWARFSRYIKATNFGIEVGSELYTVNNSIVANAGAGFTSIGTPYNLWMESTAPEIHWTIGGVVKCQMFCINGQGVFYDALDTGEAHRFQIGGLDVANISSAGIGLYPGKIISNNGVTIINGSGVLQAAGVPAFAGGDVTSLGGSLVLTIPNGTVTLAKQANMATGSLVYRKTAGAGAPEIQTLATLKTDLGLTGTNSGDQTSIVGITGTIAQFNTSITDADIVPTGLVTTSGLTMNTSKLLGRSTAAVGGVEELATVPAVNFPILAGDITTAGGTLTTALGANVVTFAKFQQVAASNLVGNATGALANATGITLGSSLAFSGSALQRAALTGDVTAAADGNATTIAANIVTFAKFQQLPTISLVGNSTGGTANAQSITLAGGLSFSGTTITPTGGALAPASVAATGAITSSSATAGIGYATGAGGAVTQLTSKSTAPPAINKLCGQITMNNAALAAGAKVSFAVSNTSCAATDIPQVAVVSGGTANAYRANVTAVSANSFTVTVENITAGSLSEAPVIGFFINKATTS